MKRENICSTNAALGLARKHGVEMPITEQMYAILQDGKSPLDAIRELKQQYQLTVLMAEQNFPQALRIADRGYVIVHGKIAFEGKSADELNNNDLIRKFYLGL